MPPTDYQWLTDRERQFLDDPDQSDQQTQSEIRYRLRRKYAGTVEAMDRLEDDPDLWDKKVRTDDVTVESNSFDDRFGHVHKIPQRPLDRGFCWELK